MNHTASLTIHLSLQCPFPVVSNREWIPLYHWEINEVFKRAEQQISRLSKWFFESFK